MSQKYESRSVTDGMALGHIVAPTAVCRNIFVLGFRDCSRKQAPVDSAAVLKSYRSAVKMWWLACFNPGPNIIAHLIKFTRHTYTTALYFEHARMDIVYRIEAIDGRCVDFAKKPGAFEVLV